MNQNFRGGSKRIFVDCTFSIVPKGFYQCLIIMVYSQPHKSYVPVFYVLLPNKQEMTYIYCMQAINFICGNELNPHSFTCDFEKALLNALQLQFPKANQILCLFHWKQAIKRKLEALHIPKELIKQLICAEGLLNLLTVIPVEDIQTKGF
jgi:hypothetical protein